MATPPTRVASVTPAVGYGSTATPKTTPTFDVVSGDLLIVVGSTEDSSKTLTTPTWTGTGTVTLRQSIVVSLYCTMYLWTVDVTATATGRTMSCTQGGSAGMWSFRTTVWRAHGGLGNTAKTNVASGAPSLALTCSDNSSITVSNDDWTATDGASRTWRTVNGSPITETLYFTSAANYTVYGGYVPDSGAAGSQTLGLTAPGAQKYSIVVAEVLGVASVALPPQRPRLIRPRWVRPSRW